MATHGAILIKQKRRSIFLHTTHDGQVEDAIHMLLDLPRYIASKVWLPKIANLTPENVVRKCVRYAGGGFEWDLWEISAAIEGYHFNRWLHIPKPDIKHLAEWSQEPGITADFTKLGVVKLVVPDLPGFTLPAYGCHIDGDTITVDMFSAYMVELVAQSKNYEHKHENQEDTDD